MKKWIAVLLRFIADWLDKPMNITIQAPAPPTDPITSVITAGLNAEGQTVKLTDDILNVINSPTAIAARHNCTVQEAQDAITRHNEQARKTGNVAAVDADLS